MKTKGGDIILLTPEEHYDYHKAWSRRSKPHHSELPPKNYPEFLSMEEGTRRGEAVSELARSHIKEHFGMGYKKFLKTYKNEI